jgi:Protein of unknown function (DUF4241)
MQLPDFSKLFEDGRAVESADFGRVVLRRHEAGRLAVPSGRVVACDPAAPGEAEAFERAFAPGAHAVVLSVAHFEDGDQRVAAAMLVAGEGAVVSWEMALLAGEDVSELAEDEVFGYATESGVGCLLDAEAAARYAEALEADDDLFGRVSDAFDDSYVDTWSWANVSLEGDDGGASPARDGRAAPDGDAGGAQGGVAGLNLVAFSTGFGDGLYASYFGLDAEGKAVALVTDFALFEHKDLA